MNTVEKKKIWWTFDTNLPWRYETSGSYQSVWCTIHESFSAHQPPKRKLPWNKVLLKKGSDMVPINNRLLMLPWFFRGVPWLVPGRNTMWKKTTKNHFFITLELWNLKTLYSRSIPAWAGTTSTSTTTAFTILALRLVLLFSSVWGYHTTKKFDATTLSASMSLLHQITSCIIILINL